MWKIRVLGAVERRETRKNGVVVEISCWASSPFDFAQGRLWTAVILREREVQPSLRTTTLKEATA